MAIDTGLEEETMRVAAIWWTQLRDPEPSVDLLERWNAWIAADPGNAQAFAQLNALGELAANASTSQRQQLIDEFAPRRVRQRRPLLAAAAAAVIGVALLGGWWTLRGGLDPASGVCLITSRCSYEMVQKAVVTGFPILAAVSAPTLMARRLAEAHNLTLIALARHDSAVLVSHPERVY